MLENLAPGRSWKILPHEFPYAPENFGYKPKSDDPLTWYNDQGLVAKYEMLHGPISEYGHEDSRIPMIHRWVVRYDALQALGILETLRKHEDFFKAPYKEQ